ncbi:MAG: hypothetical protein Q8K36_04445, partial [Alphaproteobacteria bacterium]|nr:hypothetical protein [Alphaproteobacteria bacterium]
IFLSMGILLLSMVTTGINIFWALLFLACMGGYIWTSLMEQKKSEQDQHAQPSEHDQYSSLVLFSMSAFGIFLMITGGHYFVESAIYYARLFSVPEKIIGLTVVAVGTSLPEIVTCVLSAMKKDNDMLLGNILGSSLFNILGILGVTALIHPIMNQFSDIGLDFGLMVFCLLLLWLHFYLQKPLGRSIGLLMIILYGAYCWFLFGV